MPLSLAVYPLNDAVSKPLLVVGPSLGTTSRNLWQPVVEHLDDAFSVVAWDLPGHGDCPTSDAAFTVADLAAAIVDRVDEIAGAQTLFAYAGDSIGGAVALQLMLDAPQRVHAAASLCSAAYFNGPDAWLARADLVRSDGMQSVVESSKQRWFAPGFVDKQPHIAQRLLADLEAADAEGYAKTCEALAAFDVRDALPHVRGRLLMIGGADDVAVPPAKQQEIATLTPGAELHVLDGVAHLAPAEAPAAVAALLQAHFTKES